MMTPDFTKSGNGLIPAVIQDASTQKVLMLGYMNKEAYERTLSENRITFFSRSRNRLWTKGEESGNYLALSSVSIDCDHDTLLMKAIPAGPVCHTGAATCFREENEPDFLARLEAIIASRKKEPVAGSYTSALFSSGINKIAQKVGEEAIELVIEAKDENDELFKSEAADLLFHYLVLLSVKGFSLEDVIKVLAIRHLKPNG